MSLSIKVTLSRIYTYLYIIVYILVYILIYTFNIFPWFIYNLGIKKQLDFIMCNDNLYSIYTF